MTSFHPSATGSAAAQPNTPSGAAVTVRTVQSDDASDSDLCAAEQLVKQSFGAGFRDNDWHHGLGGTHVLVNDATSTLLGHAAVVSRLIRHGTTALRAGYVEAVAVRSDLQGRGLGRVVMDHVESVVHADYQLGALNAIDTAVPFYLHRGWTLWTGATAAINRAGDIIETTDPEDRIMLLSSTLHSRELDQNAVLTCDWRAGDLW